MTTEIGQRLKKVRGFSGLSASALGTLAGLSTAIVGMIESGERKQPSGTTLAKLCTLLDVPLEWMISGTGPEPTEQQVRASIDAARAEPAANESGEHPAIDPTGTDGAAG